jgi:hypothetical protein
MSETVNLVKIKEWQPCRSVSIFSGIASVMTQAMNLNGRTTANPPVKGKNGIYRIEVDLSSGRKGYFPPNRVVFMDLQH